MFTVNRPTPPKPESAEVTSATTTIFGHTKTDEEWLKTAAALKEVAMAMFKTLPNKDEQRRFMVFTRRKTIDQEGNEV